MVVTEEFLEYVQEDALSIEVWGHRSCGSEQKDAAKRLDAEERNKSLQVGASYFRQFFPLSSFLFTFMNIEFSRILMVYAFKNISYCRKLIIVHLP